MEPPISPWLFAVLLFGGMLIMLEVGPRLGIRRRPAESEGERGSLGTIEGAMFAMSGLVVAFTFSGAAGRFNEKRALIAVEAKLHRNRVPSAQLAVSESTARTSRVVSPLCGLSIGKLPQAAKH